jgi:hypothetical protein
LPEQRATAEIYTTPRDVTRIAMREAFHEVFSG